MHEIEKLKCGCIARSNYDDCSDCKYHGKVSKGCNRLDYNPVAKKHQIDGENRNARENRKD